MRLRLGINHRNAPVRILHFLSFNEFIKEKHLNQYENNILGSEGFEPTKAEPTDLQSAPFDHSGNSPVSYCYIYTKENESLQGGYCFFLIPSTAQEIITLTRFEIAESTSIFEATKSEISAPATLYINMPS